MPTVCEIRGAEFGCGSWCVEIFGSPKEHSETTSGTIHPPVAEPACFVLDKRRIDDILNIPAGIDGPVGVVGVLNLDEPILAPTVFGEEYFSVSVEPDEDEYVATPGSRNVAYDLMLREQGVFERLNARLPAK